MRIMVCLIITVLLALPAAAEEKPLSRVATKLSEIAAGLKPRAIVVQSGRVVSLSFKTRTFLGHTPDALTGEWSEKAVEMIGPRYDGLVVQATVQDGLYRGQAALPQTFRRTYWETYSAAYPILGGKKHLRMSLSYGKRTDRKVVTTIRQFFESLVEK